MYVCECGWELVSNVRIKCPRCGKPLGDTKPLPVKVWPPWAKWVKKHQQDGEGGVGDTVERILAKAGGNVVKATLESLGLPCGCGARKEWMNETYPYSES